jgi:hypothetical protein
MGCAIKKVTLTCLVALGGFLLILPGCGTTKESGSERSESGFMTDMERFEQDFRPSDYDPEIEPAFQPKDEISETGDTEPTERIAPPAQEFVQGFRVQLFSTTSIDEGNSKKTEAEGLFPGEWFYLVYDPPSYKLRAGNFQTRFDADRFARQLVERGFRNAWVVPEKVYKNPPPRPSQPKK